MIKQKKTKCEIIIPEDCIVGSSFDGGGKEKNFEQIEDSDIILDIGPKTLKELNKIINQSKTILWNGPAGYFENKNFLNGTLSIAEIISKKTKKRLWFQFLAEEILWQL